MSRNVKKIHPIVDIFLLCHPSALPVQGKNGKSLQSLMQHHSFCSLSRFSMPTLTPQRWFSIGSRSRSWPASYALSPRRGRTASQCDSSSTAVRSQVRKIQYFMQSFSEFFPCGTHPCKNTVAVYTSDIQAFTPGQKVGHGKNNSLRKHFLEIKQARK